MHIDTGLFPHGVLQRDSRDRSRQTVTGRCPPRTTLRLRVERDGKPLRGFAAKTLAASDSKGRFAVRIDGLPVGGPYTIILTAGDAQVTVDDVLVGDVWVLAGQSNMSGVGILSDREPPQDMVRAWYMDDRWNIAEDPIHQPYLSRYPAHGRVKADAGLEARGRPKQIKGVGPGVSFGVALYERHGVPQGLIACAHGGTKLFQWNPVKSLKSLYGAMMDRVRLNGGRVAGMLWLQGASDTEPQERVDNYTRATRRIFRGFRAALGARLPIVLGQLCRVSEPNWSPTGWSSIRDQQRLFGLLPDTRCVPTIDLDLDDLVHFSGSSQCRLGRRMAEAMDSLRYGPRTAAAPIAFKDLRQERDPVTKEILLRLRFDHVIGALRSDGPPAGFTFVRDGQDILGVYRVELDGSSVIIRHALSKNDLDDATIGYGFGLNPHCTIHDEGGRPLPCFGPVATGPGYPKTDWASNASASPFLPWPGSIDTVGLPSPRTRYRTIPLMRFYNPILEMQDRSGKDRLVYFRYRFRCPEAMRLRALFDTDGPAKLWYDGEERWCDPQAANPIRPDANTSELTADAGEHEIIIALGSNGGYACGICLRLARLDKNRRRDGSKPPMPELY